MSFNLRQPTQFTVKSLLLVTKFGNIDVRAIYQELNIFDSMFMPCMRGNILILDSVGMAEKLFLDGSEYLKIEISKSDEPSSSPLTVIKAPPADQDVPLYSSVHDNVGAPPNASALF